MLTLFGREVRKRRIDVGVTLKEMADAIGVSAAFLSAVEMGKRNAGDSIVSKSILFFDEHGVNAKELRSYAEQSREEIKIRIRDAREDQQKMVVALARRFSSLTEVQVEKILGAMDREKD